MLDGRYILASETCALDIIGAHFVREVENGEIIVIDEKGLESIKPFPARRKRPCIFEYVYFARPDSIVDGRTSMTCARRWAPILAEETPVAADVIVPVPDSGVPAAIGYAQASGIPFELGIIRNHYVGRTFIQPTQSVRELGVRLKHSANRASSRASASSSSTIRSSAARLRQDRADDARRRGERSAFPHLVAADHSSRLLRHRHARPRQAARRQSCTLEEMRAYVGATRSPSSRSTASIAPSASAERNPIQPQFTDHYFTGDYPTNLTDVREQSGRNQLSLLAETG
jgi:amidophosphoribosyltransferase